MTDRLSKSPLAQDDSYSFFEDQLVDLPAIYNALDHTLTLDVMANDMAANAAKIFSVEDGDGNPITSDFELLTPDVGADGTSPWEATHGGNWVRINNGKIEFRLSDGSGVPGAGRSVDSLTGGEQFFDQFVYAIRLGNGAITQANVSISLTGANDQASIGGVGEGLVHEDQTAPAVTDKLTISDADRGESELTPVAAGTAGDGGFGSFEVLADGSWTYTLANGDAAVQELGAGEIRQDRITVWSKDGTASRVIAVTVAGSNDAPVLAADATIHPITEASETTGSTSRLDAAVTLTFTDVDRPDTHTFGSALASAAWSTGGTVPAELLSALGSALVLSSSDSTGTGAGSVTASFALADGLLDFLAAGETVTVVYTVSVTDNHGATSSQPVTFTITGSNDVPVIASLPAAAEGAVVEAGHGVPGTARAAGQLAASDADHNAALTWSGSREGTYGTFQINANGAWEYRLDNASANTQRLAQGETVTERFEAVVTDDKGAKATQVVTVTVTGTNDAPVVAGAVTGSGTEGGAAVILNALAKASDVDSTALQVTGLPASLPAGVTYDANTKQFTLDPADPAYNTLAAGQSTTVSVDYRLSDGSASTAASVSWTVTGTNDAPVLAAPSAKGDADILVARGFSLVPGSTDNLLFRNDGQNGFANSGQVLGSTESRDVILSDVDVDGDLDAVFADVTAGVRVFLNNGGGTFTLGQAWTLPSTAVQVAAGDFNGDGHPDLVVGQGGSSAMIFLNQGDGRFNTNGTYLSGHTSGANALLIGDLNGDGINDIVVSSPSHVTINLGNGSGGFSSAPIASNGFVMTLALADFDGDGDLDIYQGNTNGAPDRLLLNNGSGQFSISAQTFEAVSTQSSASGDFDGDGDVDLLVTQGTRTLLLTNNGTGHFASTLLSSTSLSLREAAQVLDANGDGHLDVVTIGPNDFELWLNGGNGSFVRSSLGSASWGYGLAVGDVDGDGSAVQKLSELTGLTGSTSPIESAFTLTFTDFDPGDSHRVGVGAASIVAAPDRVLPDGLAATLASALTGTVTATNAAGRGSVALSFSAEDRLFDFLREGETLTLTYEVTVLDSSGDSSTTQVTIVVTGTNDAPKVTGAVSGTATEDGGAVPLRALANASDIDDGATLEVVLPETLPDGVSYDPATKSFVLDPTHSAFQSLAAGERATVTVSYGVSDGTDTTAASVEWVITGTSDDPRPISLQSVGITSTPGIPVHGAIGDLNNDGRADFVVNNYNNGTVAVHLGDGSGGIGNATAYRTTHVGPLMTHDVELGDFNNDGNLDVLTTNLSEGSVSVLLGNGDGTLGPATNTPISALAGFAVLDDIDGDGNLDALVSAGTDWNSFGLYFLRGKGDGGFEEPGLVSASDGTAHPMAYGDINGDGNGDVLYRPASGGVAVLLGNGDGTFTSAGNFGGVSAPQAIALGDFDADGKMDFAATDYLGGGIWIARGNGDGTFGGVSHMSAGALNPNSLAAVDMNGDGILDLVTGNDSGSLSVLAGHGDGSFASPVVFASGAATRMIVGDMNGDSYPDVAAMHFFQNTIEVFINTSDSILP